MVGIVLSNIASTVLAWTFAVLQALTFAVGTCNPGDICDPNDPGGGGEPVWKCKVLNRVLRTEERKFKALQLQQASLLRQSDILDKQTNSLAARNARDQNKAIEQLAKTGYQFALSLRNPTWDAIKNHVLTVVDYEDLTSGDGNSVSGFMEPYVWRIIGKRPVGENDPRIERDQMVWDGQKYRLLTKAAAKIKSLKATNAKIAELDDLLNGTYIRQNVEPYKSKHERIFNRQMELQLKIEGEIVPRILTLQDARLTCR